MLLILCDFDGTIANSEKKFYSILKSFVRDKIPESIIDLDKFTEDFYYKNCLGKKYYESFKTLGAHNIIDYSKVTEAHLNTFLDYLTVELDKVKEGEITFTTGMKEFLEKISKEKNLKFVIDTNARLSDFLSKSKPLNSDFIKEVTKNKNVYSVSDIKKDFKYLNLEKYKTSCKPNPAVFMNAIEDLKNKNYEFENIIIIEDSPSAVKGGKNFKETEYAKNFKEIKIVGYTAGDHKPDGKTLTENGADIIIDNAEDLFNFIKKYN